MTETEREIVAALQGGLPDSLTPWEDAARALGMTAQDLLARVEAMRRSGLVRSVRAILDQRQLGLAGNVLVAWNVEPDRADALGAAFAAHAEVSHCVRRTAAPLWPYTLYTMIHAETREAADMLVARMRETPGVTDCVVLHTLRELKKTPPRYV